MLILTLVGVTLLFALAEQNGTLEAVARRFLGALRDPRFVPPHYVWGQRYLLRVEEVKARPSVELRPTDLVLRVRPGSTARAREAVLEAWHRDLLKEAAVPLFAKWEEVMGVKVGELFTQHMRTRWGTCNTRARSIRLNTELVKKPAECLEYVIVHEMVHLIEPSHNARFKSLMTRFTPNWSVYRQMLNRLPVRHEKWDD